MAKWKNAAFPLKLTDENREKIDADLIGCGISLNSLLNNVDSFSAVSFSRRLSLPRDATRTDHRKQNVSRQNLFNPLAPNAASDWQDWTRRVTLLILLRFGCISRWQRTYQHRWALSLLSSWLMTRVGNENKNYGVEKNLCNVEQLEMNGFEWRWNSGWPRDCCLMEDNRNERRCWTRNERRSVGRERERKWKNDAQALSNIKKKEFLSSIHRSSLSPSSAMSYFSSSSLKSEQRITSTEGMLSVLVTSLSHVFTHSHDTLLFDAKHLISLHRCTKFSLGENETRPIINAAIHSTRQSSERQLSFQDGEGKKQREKKRHDVNEFPSFFPSPLGLFLYLQCSSLRLLFCSQITNRTSDSSFFLFGQEQLGLSLSFFSSSKSSKRSIHQAIC